jgi:hypothetical protein
MAFNMVNADNGNIEPYAQRFSKHNADANDA